MKTDLSISELLALVTFVDEHVGRNHGFDPLRLVREVQQKLDGIIVRHRGELDGRINQNVKAKRQSEGRH